MRWSTILGFVILLLFAASVEGILAFSFCAIVSFVFTRSLLNGENSLDFTRYFASKKGLGTSKDQRALSVTAKQFPRGLKKCRHALIRNILRDFVISWYENVGIGGDFILETRSLLEDATVTFYDKLARTTVSSHTEKLCVVLHKHLAAMEAVRLTIPKNHKDLVKKYQKYHSLRKETRTYENHELHYLRNLTDLLLYRLIAPEKLGCDVGRYILREILAVKLFLPLVNKISDPNFLNASIINIFGENKGESQLPATPLDSNDAGKCNLKVSTSFMEYLDEKFESEGHEHARKTSETAMKYQFKEAIVVEKDHSELVEISMEEYSPRTNSVLAENNVALTSKSVTETFDKMNDSSLPKRLKHTVKELGHSSGMLNGFNKIKNDILKPYKEKGQSPKCNDTLSARIHSSGAVISRQLRKIYSNPVIRLPTEKDFGDHVEAEESTTRIVSDTDDLAFSNEESQSSDSHHRSASLSCDGPNDVAHSFSHSKTISGHAGSDSVSSSYDDIEILNSHKKLEGINIPDGSVEPGATERRHHLTSFSSTGEWDCELCEKSDNGLVIDAGAEPMEENGVSLLPSQLEDDTISTANFAINDLPNPCSMIGIPSTQMMTDHSFEPIKSRYTVYVIVVRYFICIRVS